MNLLNNLNNLHRIIKNFDEYFPYSFEKTGINRCGHCNGTGLKSGKDLEKYCENCRGFGYVDIEEMLAQHVCRVCKGSGYLGPSQECRKCNGIGLVDWISFVRGEQK